MTPPPRRLGRTGWRGWSGRTAGRCLRRLRGAPACGLPVSPVITGEVRDAGGRLRLIGIDPFTAPEASNGPPWAAAWTPRRFWESPASS
jgi:hypothetical protein